MQSDRRSEPLSGVDTAWLKLEEPGNPMIVVGLLGLASPLAAPALREVVRARFLRFAAFRSSIRNGRIGVAHLDEEPAVDLSWHVVEERLAAPGDEAALRGRVAELLAAHLDPARPLWRMHLLQGNGGGSVLVVRIHHAYADGTALLQVLLALTEGDDTPLPRPHRFPEHQEGIGALLDAARRGAQGAAALGRLLLLPPDPASSLRSAVGSGKRAAWSRALPLEPLKAIAHAHAGTLNDVLVAAAAGAIRHELQERGESVDALSFRALVPVDLRHPDELGKLGNRFGLVLLDLPVGIAGPKARLAAVHERMDALKRSAEAVVAFRLLHALGVATPQLESPAVRIVHSKATVMLTNVAGPRTRRTLAGVPIETLLYWIPAAGGIGLGLSLLSYAGSVRLAVGADARCVPEPQRLAEGFEHELARLS